jgi:hypothetical protein
MRSSTGTLEDEAVSTRCPSCGEYTRGMDLVARGAPDLARWEARPFWPAIAAGPRRDDARDHLRRDVGLEAPGPPVAGGAFERVAAAILRYEVFPPDLVEGVLRRAPVEPGDTVGIRYKGLRIADVFFAARVVDRFRRLTGGVVSEGFTYRTLVGHPELGEETFSVAKQIASGRVSVELRSWSRPGTRLARLAAPIVRRLQTAAGRAALDHLGRIASAREPGR